MGGFTSLPYARPTLYRSRSTGTIADLISRGGDIAAQGAARSGDIWGGAVNQLGQIAGQAVGQYAQQKEQEGEQEKREQSVNAALEQWNPEDPQGSFMNLAMVMGPGPAMDVTKGLLAIQQSQAKADQPPDPELFAAKVGGLNALRESLGPEYIAKKWQEIAPAIAPDVKAFLGVDLGGEWTEEYDQALSALNARFNPEKPAGQVLETVDEQGRPVRRRVGEEELARGVPIPQPPPEPTLEEEARKREILAAASARGTASVRPRPGPADDTGRVIAEAWSAGTAFPSTQSATTAALTYMDEHPEEFPAKPRKLSVAQQTEVVGATDTLTTIQDVRDAYEKVKGKVGPFTYRLNELARKIPGTDADPDFVTFNTLLRGMGNLEIKRITGAQMSEKEADRLLKGMATGSLKPADFEAALAVMERNASRRKDILLYGKVQEGRGKAEATAGGIPVTSTTGEATFVWTPAGIKPIGSQ